MNQMPEINLDADETGRMALVAMSYDFTNPITGVSEHVNGLDVARMIVGSQGKNKGRLRASKPDLNESIIERERYGHVGKYRTMPLVNAAAAQVWRYVAFSVSPLSQHHCMPVLASFDAPFDMPTEEIARFSKWCQGVADVVIDTVPADRRHGLNRWAKAFGIAS